MSHLPIAVPRPDRYKVPVDDYVFFNRNGYLVIKNLVPVPDVERLKEWSDDILFGREAIEGLEPAPESATLEELLSRFTRIHQLHRVNATGEWGLLHPRVLDALEALIGPDVLALQSMLFFNPPGKGGQGWHQDAYYITTYPDSLIGVWLPLEPADEENGCLWVAPGSGNEPIYPAHNPWAHIHAAETFEDLAEVDNVSHLDDSVNTLSPIVRRYPPPISVPMEPGDALFFNGRLFHRSFPNQSKERFRRAYVCHYCNARSWVPWNHGASFPNDCANEYHILARGWTHLLYANPKYGTSVDLSPPDPNAEHPSRMVGYPSGDMEPESGLSAHADTPVG